MYNDTHICIRGYAGADPEIHTNGDNPTLVMSVGVTARVWNRSDGQMRDAPTQWFSVRCFGALADNVHASVRKGTPVMVRGRLVPREWTDREGNTHRSQAIMAESVGIDLSSGVARYTKVRRSMGQEAPEAAAHPPASHEASVSSENASQSSGGAPVPGGEDRAPALLV